MRFLLLALMIALLPVRGWMGNAMAIDMSSQAVAKAQKTRSAVSASAAADTDASMPADCPMHARQANQEVGSTEAPVNGVHCNACDTCELCLALATSTLQGAADLAFAKRAAPLATGYRFSSADRLSSLKPPIS